MEWKFARTKLWLNYIDNGSTLPAPLNIVPTANGLIRTLKNFKQFFKEEADVVAGHARSTHFIKVSNSSKYLSVQVSWSSNRVFGIRGVECP